MSIIPGQSLTAEPKNAPYENPPQMNTPEDATEFHLGRLSEAKRKEALLDTLELGLDIVSVTEGILRAAVLEGRHSIDISLIIAPIIHEFIKSTADRNGVEYDEGIEDEKDEENRVEIRYQINVKKATKLIEEAEARTGEDYIESEDEDDVDETEDSMPSEEEDREPKGLMSRKGSMV